MSTFRVIQFNMQFGQIWDETYPDRAPIRLESTLEEIRSHNPDVILLQEVEKALPGGVQLKPPPNYMRLHAELPGYDSWFSYPRADPRELPFGLGLAIFSRGPLYGHLRMDLPSPPIEFEFFGKKTTPTDRLLIGAYTTIQGREVKLLNTHLLAFFMLNSSSTAHPFQRNMIAEQLSDSHGPTVLAGDFNVTNHRNLVDQFAQCGYQTVQQTEITWRRRPFVLDHIFYNNQLRCVSHRVVPTPASDHHVMVADFEFVKK